MKKHASAEGTLITGTAREILTVYKNLRKREEFFCLFADYPKVNKYKRYGILLRDNGEFTIVNQSAIMLILDI